MPFFTLSYCSVSRCDRRFVFLFLSLSFFLMLSRWNSIVREEAFSSPAISLVVRPSLMKLITWISVGVRFGYWVEDCAGRAK